ncbi:unnamed protein product [Bursaphelenchus okinawaensis]|uniref:NADH dehydrogenase [ubiquinone] 1 beta subcomplex subunit 10 n=1 Tax=Bursaphelenchus okinawaensis TaxID=465554 RepID=A0A811LS50_9BILA|nr:unnamed protein product [Bursaphelenchus okinawaensis]CAG9128627.1 unnamed protein product [Bursaphelenchus okinawaensis]
MATEAPEKQLSALQARRLKDKESWDAYWKLREVDSRGTIWPRAKYYAQRAFDWPATAFKENVLDPLHDRYRPVYYQRKFTRVPDIDQCGVSDNSCIYEANEQYRLDKTVDTYILELLLERMERCFFENEPYLQPCSKAFEDYEEAELNWFIKYGELGIAAGAQDVYMKQKHRMIWERQHPEIMAEREEKLKKHKAELAAGNFDYSFWKGGIFYMDKKNMEPPYELQISKGSMEADKPLSKDWEYYKKVSQDPEFDKRQGKHSDVPLFPKI